MPIARLIIKELLYRKLNAALGILAIALVTALFVAYLTSAEASRRETTRVTRDIGFNVRIIPAATDMDQFWSTGYSDETMPEDAVERLAKFENVFFSYNHLVAVLQRRYVLQGQEVLLTGLAPAITAPEQKKQPMGYSIKSGHALLGFQVWKRLGLKKGDTFEMAGRPFTVEMCLVESGAEDDIRLFLALADAQQVLQLPKRINEIKAIDCLCMTTDQDPLSKLRTELARALPEAKVVQLRAIADARAKQRQMTDRYFALATPFLLVVCAAWVCVLAILNVRERRAEIGVLRALGYRSVQVAALFLGKAVLIGIAGAALGYAVGSALSLHYGAEIFPVTAKAIQLQPQLLLWVVLAAPAFAALASFVPAMMAVTQDPAVVLREE
ncbi:MAG: ABC transporter permease [Verrucomicrobiia bacterium]